MSIQAMEDLTRKDPDLVAVSGPLSILSHIVKFEIPHLLRHRTYLSLGGMRAPPGSFETVLQKGKH
jgi:hypothetical protein